MEGIQEHIQKLSLYQSHLFPQHHLHLFLLLDVGAGVDVLLEEVEEADLLLEEVEEVEEAYLLLDGVAGVEKVALQYHLEVTINVKVL